MKVDTQTNKKNINSIIVENKISSTVIQNYQADIAWYIANHFDCPKNNDGNLNYCEQKNPGYKQNLRYENDRFYRELIFCEHSLVNQKKLQFLNRFLISDFNPLDNNKSFFKTNDQNLDFFLLNWKDTKTHDIIEKKVQSEKEYLTKKRIVEYYQEVLKGQKKYGIYLYGGLGLGKTTLFQFLAIDAAKNHNKTISFISVSNLANRLKNSFNFQLNFEQKEDKAIIEKLQIVDLLFLDDIGGEPASEWLRDDVLFTILNYRMENQKTTFFTSNFSISRLAKNYEDKIGKNFGGSKNDNKLKNERFIERINVLAKEVELIGENHRIK